MITQLLSIPISIATEAVFGSSAVSLSAVVSLGRSLDSSTAAALVGTGALAALLGQCYARCYKCATATAVTVAGNVNKVLAQPSANPINFHPNMPRPTPSHPVALDPILSHPMKSHPSPAHHPSHTRPRSIKLNHVPSHSEPFNPDPSRPVPPIPVPSHQTLSDLIHVRPDSIPSRLISPHSTHTCPTPSHSNPLQPTPTHSIPSHSIPLAVSLDTIQRSYPLPHLTPSNPIPLHPIPSSIHPKVVAIIISRAIFGAARTTSLQLCGMAICLCGAFMFSLFRVREGKAGAGEKDD